MPRLDSGTVTLLLAGIAAALALVAAAVGFLRSGELRWELVGAGLFILAFGIGVRSRSKRNDVADKGLPPQT